ncbi:MAG: PIN domain-containing protein [Erythrobacter sp.]|jgi:hypothetical protein
MLVDANVWSELVRPVPEPRVVDFLGRYRDSLFLSSIVVAEIEYGISNARDETRRSRLRNFLEDTIILCAGRILLPDFATAAVFGSMKARLRTEGLPIDDIDLLIAAQAIVAAMPLATRNVSHLERTGATIVNPWNA